MNTPDPHDPTPNPQDRSRLGLLNECLMKSQNRPTFTLGSSCGELCCDAETGEVYAARCIYAGPELRPIYKINLAEWRQTYPSRELAGLQHDILDFGYFYYDENGFAHHEEPEHDWRREFGPLSDGKQIGITLTAKAGRCIAKALGFKLEESS